MLMMHRIQSLPVRKRLHIYNHLKTITNVITYQHGIKLRLPTTAVRKRESWMFVGGHKHYATRTLASSSSVAAEEEIEEETYSRMSPLEHILRRPGMYVGSVERVSERCFLLDDATVESFRPISDSASAIDEEKPVRIAMKQRITHRTPALLKIFDEILVNASDNRLRTSKNPTTKIDVVIDPGCVDAKRPPFISVRNNGQGIPIHMHQTEKLYIPEMVFGHLLTGSNFHDEHKTKRLTGGRHGYGAKLANIFSDNFTIQTLDTKSNSLYRQTWTNNMRNVSIPEISFDPSEHGYTYVSLQPDLNRLLSKPSNEVQEDNFLVIPDDDFAHMCQRVIDIAGCCYGGVNPLQVTLNGKLVPVHNFEEYCWLFCNNDTNDEDDEDNKKKLYFKKINSRWEVGISLSETGSFQCLSFVNGMFTSRGGTHVNDVVQQIVKKLEANKKLSEISSLPSLIKRHLFIFVNAFIENPMFDSQMKESLTTQSSKFGSQCHLSETVLKEMINEIGIVEKLLQSFRGVQEANILKKISYNNIKTRDNIASLVPKLEDAHLAGQPPSSRLLLRSGKQRNCTLILTEGDSAKALAVAGLEVVGRDRYGVFPLRGKFLNVRAATLDQIANNEELKNLCTILGLDFKKGYKTQAERGTLRYDKVMIMADQDSDGSHIKGLIVNVFRCFWPRLLMAPVDNPSASPFLSVFMTPLIKATPRNNVKRKQEKTQSFFSLLEYNAWRAALEENGEFSNYDIKYYKGLGTSTDAEAREYFNAFSSHYRPFAWATDTDGQRLDMFFDKNRAMDRRNWMLRSNPTNTSLLDYSMNAANISYTDFVDKEMIHFANADNIRSIPCFVDGLKPSQRKILYSCFKRNLHKEIKVAQLSGYVSEHTAYHHGEASIHATIVGMAQDFVGSNNVSLLMPSGQFGTRFLGGQDSASPRYIYTKLSDISRLLFPEVDDDLLEYNYEDGQKVEPLFYCPVIPFVLVNGAKGIGTGWSTFIPPCNIVDLIDFMLCKVEGNSSLPVIRPYVKNFKGTITAKHDGTGYITNGTVEKLSPTSIAISELPVGTWTNSYKLHLIKMREEGAIQSFSENHTTKSVSFTISVTDVQLAQIMKKGMLKTFQLQTSLPTTNMNLFDQKWRVQKFNSFEEIADAFVPIRLDMYRKRKQKIEQLAEFEAAMLRSKARFIELVADGKIDLIHRRRTKCELIKNLMQLNFLTMQELNSIKQGKQGIHYTNVRGNYEANEYNYLLNMPISSFTSEFVDDLKQDATNKEEYLEKIRNTSAVDLWKLDLKKLKEFVTTQC